MVITAFQYLNNLNTQKHFTGVFHYTRPVRSKHDRYIEMYGLLSVKSDVEIPGANIAKFAWDGVVDGFEYSKADSTNDALKIALTEATRRIKQLITNDSNISNHGVDVNFSVFVSGASGLYIGCIGESDIYLYKGGKIVDIYEMLSRKGAKTAGLLLENEDIIFSSTSNFLKRHMNKLVGLPNVGSVFEKLDEMASELENGEGMVIFTRDGDTEPEVEEIDPEMQSSERVDSSLEGRVDQIKQSGEVKRSGLAGVLLAVQGFLVKVKEKLLPVFSKAGPIYTKVKDSLGKANFSLQRKLSSFLGYINEKLGKRKWFKKISARFTQSEINIPRRGDFKSFKVDGYKIKNKKIERFKIVILAVLGIVLVVGGIRFTINQREARAVSKQANEIFKMVEEFVDSAEGKTRTDRASAETLVFRADTELGKVPERLGEKDAQKLKQLEGRVLGIRDDLYKRSGLVDSDGSIETYLDTRLAFGEGSQPSDIAIYQDSKGNEYILVVDKSIKAVFRISLYNKEVQRLPDPDRVLQDPSMIYIGNSGLFVMDLKVGVLRAEFDSDGWFKPFVKLTGLSIENIGADDIAEFAVLTESDNVYILDKKAGALLKSSNFGSGYGLSFEYIKEEALLGANDILADLSVYILTSGPDGLKRYIYSYFESKQIPAELGIVGLDGEFKNLSYGYTRGDLNYDLYVFDSEDKRVMRFEKPMEGGGEVRHPNQAVLKNQYVYRGSRENIWSDVKDFVVNRDQKTLYMLDSSTIWEVRL